MSTRKSNWIATNASGLVASAWRRSAEKARQPKVSGRLIFHPVRKPAAGAWISSEYQVKVLLLDSCYQQGPSAVSSAVAVYKAGTTGAFARLSRVRSKRLRIRCSEGEPGLDMRFR